MSPIYWGLIIVGILLAYTGLSYTRSQAIRVANTFFFAGRGAVFLGWTLFAVSMASVSVGTLGILGMPVLASIV